MRKSLLFGAMLLVASCSVQKEEEFESPIQHRYHAVAEDAVDAETRVFTDSKLRVRWNEGDHISIFERNTYNQEFEFLGDTGDTAGDFDPVESSGYHSSGDIEDGHVYAVYPYEKKNKCDFDGKLTVTFPSVQHYKKDSFGVGANVMVAKTNTLDLRFMHVGGYRTFKLYGEGVSVSSVRIESNGSEYLSGRTDVVIGGDGKPEVSFVESTSNSKSVELVCDTPVALGGSADEAVEFWFVLPPGTLSEGFTVTITDENGNEFMKSTSNAIEIKSGVKKSMPAFEVEMGNIQPNTVIYYTTTDGMTVTPDFGEYLYVISNVYENGKGIIAFDDELTSIKDFAFLDCTNLSSISLPMSVKSIGEESFKNCYNLTSINLPASIERIGVCAFFNCTHLVNIILPNGLTSISNETFCGCSGLSSISIPNSVTSIGDSAFSGCHSLTNIVLPKGLTTIGERAFSYCTNLTSIELPNGLTNLVSDLFRGCSNLVSVTIPSSVTIIGDEVFFECSNLSSISLPTGLTSIGNGAFYACNSLTDITIPETISRIWWGAFEDCSTLSSITILATNPPTLFSGAFFNTNDCPIYVPAGSVNAYKDAEEWSSYANRIQAIPPETTVIPGFENEDM